jgi:hypothetical protein
MTPATVAGTHSTTLARADHSAPRAASVPPSAPQSPRPSRRHFSSQAMAIAASVALCASIRAKTGSSSLLKNSRFGDDEGEGEITGSLLPLLLGACLHAFRLSAHRIELAGTAPGRPTWGVILPGTTKNKIDRACPRPTVAVGWAELNRNFFDRVLLWNIGVRSTSSKIRVGTGSGRLI